jgi:oxygen-independent coproporphyrinogen-3 oxidase
MAVLYVHVPFCPEKCSYCAFYSVAIGRNKTDRDNRNLLVRKYLDGLHREILLRRQDAPKGVSSVFIGGGTPTALNEEELKELLSLINEFNDPTDGIIERTIECNPGTINRAKAEIFSQYGINRVSLGVQALDEGLLKKIGRVHNVKQAEEAAAIVREAGINSIYLDLMFGLPGQTKEKWLETLEKALALKPQHLSVYALTIEEETPFARKYANNATEINEALLPDDDLQADMYEMAVEFLKKAGYIHYEISNFALPGFECRHNLSYWRSEQYIGLGPAAVSCLDEVRSKNFEDIDEYYENMINNGKWMVIEENQEKLTKEQVIFEYMMLGLRTAEGVAFANFYDRFQKGIKDIYGDFLEEYISRGLLISKGGRLKLNPQYFFVANAILTKFIL